VKACTITNNDIPVISADVPVPVNSLWALLMMILTMLAGGWYFRPAVMRRF